LQPSLRNIAKTKAKARTRNNHPASGLKNQQEIAPATIHRTIARLPKISNDLEYSFESVLIDINSLRSNAQVALIDNPQTQNTKPHLTAILRVETNGFLEFC
jgi:hypothetical protein